MSADQLDPTQAVAARIRQWRRARHMSCQELSDALAELGCKMARSTLSDLENGRHPGRLRVHEVFAIAHVLDVPVQVLLQGAACGSCGGVPPVGFACLECGEKHERAVQ